MIRIATSRGGAKLGVLGLLVLAALVGFVPMAQATPMVKHSPSLMAAGTPGSEAIGNTTTESATLSGAFFPSPVPAGYTYGTMTFTVYGPFNSAPPAAGACKTANLAPLAAADTNPSTVSPINANATYSPTAAVTPQAVGYYVWNVSYSGDTDNNAAANFTGNNGCSSDVVQLIKATPTLMTSPTPPST